MTRSHVWTFHIEPAHVDEVLHRLDLVEDDLARNPHFRGLICLDHSQARHEIVVTTMWDGQPSEDTDAVLRQARQTIEDSCGLGVRSERYVVPRRVAGDAAPVLRTTPYRVLLIDDDEGERELLKSRLQESARFVVVGQAVDGPDGVVIADEGRPDLVVLDMSLPGGDGIATIRKIQTVSPNSTIVVVSGLVSSDLVHATVDIMEAASCLDKNIGPDRLVDEFLNALEDTGDRYHSSQRAAIDRACVIDQRLMTLQSPAEAVSKAATHPPATRPDPHGDVGDPATRSASEADTEAFVLVS